MRSRFNNAFEIQSFTVKATRAFPKRPSSYWMFFLRCWSQICTNMVLSMTLNCHCILALMTFCCWSPVKRQVIRLLALVTNEMKDNSEFDCQCWIVTNLRKVSQHFRHFVSTLTASDVDDDVAVGILWKWLGYDGLPTTKSTRNGSRTALYTPAVLDRNYHLGWKITISGLYWKSIQVSDHKTNFRKCARVQCCHNFPPFQLCGCTLLTLNAIWYTGIGIKSFISPVWNQICGKYCKSHHIVVMCGRTKAVSDVIPGQKTNATT